jgi:hypothetical protein
MTEPPDDTKAGSLLPVLGYLRRSSMIPSPSLGVETIGKS